jgi:hypothetical protein
MINVVCGLLLIGVLFVILMSMLLRKRDVDGYLRIDTSDPDDNPYLFLELTKDVSTIYKKKYVTFEVNTQNYISQK